MGKLRVLLADDHAIIRDGLKQILADTDDLFVAGEASNGVETMQRVRDEVWDVLVLDISMPGRGGLELVRMIKDERPDLPILILSMHHEEQYAVRALKAGAQGYLTKESDADLLLAAIRKVANGGVYVSDKVAELIPEAEQKAREQQFVQPGQALLDILDDSVLELEFLVPSSWLGWLKVGTAFQVEIDETRKRYPAKFIRIGARVDPVSQSVKVAAAIDGKFPELIAGMSGRVQIQPPK